jgi:hypothetical protein
MMKAHLLPRRIIFFGYYSVEVIALAVLFFLTYIYAQSIFGEATIILQLNPYEYERIEKARELREFFIFGASALGINGGIIALITKKQIFTTKIRTLIIHWLHWITISLIVCTGLYIWYIISLNT